MGAQGPVSYQAVNLPQGVSLQNNKLVVHDNTRVRNGNYPIRIRVQDASGAADEQVVVVTVNALRGDSVRYTNNAAFGNFQAARTISISETSRNNLRFGASEAAGLAGVSAAEAAAAAAPAAPAEVPQPDAGVAALLDSLQVPLAAGSGAAPAGGAPADGSYPTIKFPTGGNPDVPNFTPTQIASNQAQRTPSNRNTITADDVKARVIFDRQMNAAKALANLLSIVKQATANKNAAQEEVNKRQQLLNGAANKQRDAQAAVTKAEADVARVRQGITQLTESFAALQKKQADINNRLKDLNDQTAAANQGIQTAQNQLNDVNFQSNAADKNLADAYDLKNNREKECNDYDGEIRAIETNRFVKAADVDAARRDLPAAKSKVDYDTQRVNDLIAQLDAAKNELANAQKALSDLEAREKAAVAALADLDRRIEDLKARKAKCADELAAINNKIQELANIAADLKQKKQRIEEEIKTLNNKVNDYKNQAKDIPAELKAIDDLFAQIQKNLAFLRSQLPIFLRIQNDAYAAGNAANDAVKIARDNLDAATKRFLDETKIAETATRNIELARIEKEQADAALEALLKDGAAVLPYAAAPADAANLPLPNPDANGAFPIKNWVDFVGQAFGIGVKPYFVGDLSTLYSTTLPGQPAAPDAAAAPGAAAAAAAPAGVAVVADAELCAGDNLKAISGYVVGVAPGSIQVLDGNNSYNVQYAGCTKAYASKPNYNIAVGDVVVIKGLPEQHGFLATQVACAAQ